MQVQNVVWVDAAEKISGSMGEAEDVVQETLTALWERLSGVSRRKLKAYLFRFNRNASAQGSLTSKRGMNLLEHSRVFSEADEVRSRQGRLPTTAGGVGEVPRGVLFGV